MKKRLVSMILVLCCLFSLVGCGGETSEPVESDNPPASSSVGESGASSAPVTVPTETPELSTDPQPTDTPKPSEDPQPTDTPTPPENSTFS